MNIDNELLDLQSEGEHALLTIKCDLTVSNAARLTESLLQIVDQFDFLKVDTLGVGETDVAGIQLLLSLRQQMVNKNKVLEFTLASPLLAETVQLLGLRSTLNFPAAAATDKS